MWQRLATRPKTQYAVRSFVPALWCLLLVVVSFLGSCTTHEGYEHYVAVRTSGWDYRDSVRFDVDSLSSAGTRHFTLALRRTAAQAYPYTSLTLAVQQTWHLGDSLLTARTDTLVCPFENPDGRLRTKGISLYPYEFALPALELPLNARGHIVVRHLMNRQSLPGFDAIGLRME